MMMRHRALGRTYSFLGGARNVCLAAGPILAATIKADIDKISEHVGAPLASALRVLQPQVWWLSLLLLVLGGLFGVARNWIGNPATWRIVKHALGDLREAVFDDGDSVLHEHRVTLFRHVKWAWVPRMWPWSGWLVPVERSGHTTQSSGACFLAPDDAVRAEGVAGMTWASNKSVQVYNLPDLTSNPTDASIEEYARNTRTPLELAKRRRFPAQSYYGIPIEVRNEPWGVIVFDSRNAVIKHNRIKKDCQLLLRYLSKTLEGL